jgi:RimJ/RimL family protein N-acetyltransferase
MTCLTSDTNKRCRRLMEGCGFKHEGTHPLAFDGVEAMVSYGLTESDLIYKPRASHGQVKSESAACA